MPIIMWFVTCRALAALLALILLLAVATGTRWAPGVSAPATKSIDMIAYRSSVASGLLIDEFPFIRIGDGACPLLIILGAELLTAEPGFLAQQESGSVVKPLFAIGFVPAPALTLHDLPTPGRPMPDIWSNRS